MENGANTSLSMSLIPITNLISRIGHSQGFVQIVKMKSKLVNIIATQASHERGKSLKLRRDKNESFSIKHLFWSRIILIQETIKNLILSYDPDVMLDDSSPMRRLLSTFDDVYLSYGGHNLQELHKHTVKTLFTWADQREYEVKALAGLQSNRFGRIDIKRKFSRIDVHRQAASISKQLVALEVRPEGWKRLQFSHIKSFPFSTWWVYIMIMGL